MSCNAYPSRSNLVITHRCARPCRLDPVELHHASVVLGRKSSKFQTPALLLIECSGIRSHDCSCDALTAVSSTVGLA